MSSSTDFPLDDFAGVGLAVDDGRDTTPPRTDRGGASEPRAPATGSARGSDRESDLTSGRASTFGSRRESGGAFGEGSGRDTGTGSRVVAGTLLETGALTTSRASGLPHEAHAGVPSTA